ncbi:MAG TPA: hypothetical protein VNH84_20140 [Candidatus Saccharimonadales bacterium]|nr:hypothetical protein [Candidatus Saccharimonadales bacterium]
MKRSRQAGWIVWDAGLWFRVVALVASDFLLGTVRAEAGPNITNDGM